MCIAGPCFALLLAFAPPSAPTEEWPQVVDQLLDHYDVKGTFPSERPPLASKDRPAWQWLHTALDMESKANPFPRAHPRHREAAELQKLLQGRIPPQASPRLAEPGSQLRYWRWGARQVREGHWDRSTRQRWEDHLLRPGVHLLLRGLALRHAFCFALAEGDEGRFVQLKEQMDRDAPPEMLSQFQTAFALLGAWAPSFRLWALPDLAPVTVPLAESKVRHVRIAQPESGPLATPPPDTLWIVPTQQGQAPEYIDQLDGDSREELRGLAARLPKDAARVFAAPTYQTLATYGLLYFPVLLDLDAAGRIAGIRMGDAALAAPVPPPLLTQ